MLQISEAPSAGAGSRAATPRAALDRAVGTVRQSARAFARLAIAEKIELLRTAQHNVARVMHAWVRRGCESKGLDANGPEVAEEWFGGPIPTVRNVRLLIESLEH